MSGLLVDPAFLVGPAGTVTSEFLLALEHLAQELSFSQSRWYYSIDILPEVFRIGLLDERRLRQFCENLQIEINTRLVVAEVSSLLQNPRQAVDSPQCFLASPTTVSQPFSGRSPIAPGTYEEHTGLSLLVRNHCRSDDTVFVSFGPAPGAVHVTSDVSISDVTSISVGTHSQEFKVALSPNMFAQSLGHLALDGVADKDDLVHLFRSFAARPFPSPHTIKISDSFFAQFVANDVRGDASLVETLLRNVALLAQGGPSLVEANHFRKSENSDEQKVRMSDNSSGFRLQLTKSGVGWRLNFWFRHGQVELGSIEKKNAKPSLPE